MEIRIRHLLMTARSNGAFHDLLRDGAFERAVIGDVDGDGDGGQQLQVSQVHAAQNSRAEHGRRAATSWTAKHFIGL